MRLSKSRNGIVAVVLSVCVFLLGGCGKEATHKQAEPKTLFAYVGANLKNPVSELAANYEEKTGVKVELTFNNSAALTTSVRMAPEPSRVTVFLDKIGFSRPSGKRCKLLNT